MAEQPVGPCACCGRSAGRAPGRRGPAELPASARRARPAGGRGRRGRRAASRCAAAAGSRSSDGPAGTAGARIADCPGAAILDVLDADARARRGGRDGPVAVHGSLDDVVRAHDTLIAYVARGGARAVAAGTARRAARRCGSATMSEQLIRTRGAAPASCRRRPTAAVLGGGIAGLTAAHELAERGFDVTVYETAHSTSGPGWATGPRARTRRSSSAASPPPSSRRSGPTAAAPPSCARSRAGAGSPAPPSGRSPASTASASSRPTTCTSGTCCSASRSTRRDGDRGTSGLAADLPHGHGQRPAGDHPGHHDRRQAVARLPPRGAAQPRRDALGPGPAGAVGLHRRRRADFQWPDAALPGHQPAAPGAELQNMSAYDFFVGARRDGRPAGSPTPTVRGAYPRHAQGARRVRLALGRRPHQPHHLPAAAAADGPP